MDRTREFYLFAEATEVPQRESETGKDTQSCSIVSTSSQLIDAIEKDVATIEKELQGRRGTRKELFARTEHSLRSLLSLQSSFTSSPLPLHHQIGGSIRRRYASLSLRLAQALREEQKQRKEAVDIELERSKPPRQSTHPQGHMLQTPRQEILREEISTVRKRELERIEEHINELGKMVSEVSMHISMQGEKLERIDELFSQSRTSMKKGYFEMSHALRSISQRRRTIIGLFAVLFLVLFLKVMVG
ncbi:hypothetical protein NEDG_00136 [Nematocida displodere]|uniref:t-SNARE coiled-coil homology domain-containing protein n=1 Tax=Nematocida displodere TaxID=1805483 RepID=A0A177EJL3_9MICR|nr:hypothetical protein NEDG_00136 [Nematocida displodere]